MTSVLTYEKKKISRKKKMVTSVLTDKKVGGKKSLYKLQ